MKILICNLGIGSGGAEKVLIDFIAFFTYEYNHYKNTLESNGGGGQHKSKHHPTKDYLINPKTDIDLFLIEKKQQDVYLKYCESTLHKVFTFPHIFGKVRFMNKFIKRRVLKHPWLINHFIKEQYDVNIAFLEGISCIYIAHKKGGKKIGYIHTTLKEMRQGKRDEQEAQSLMLLDSIICVSHCAKNSLLALYPELKHKHIVVLYNPIDKQTILAKAALKTQTSNNKHLQIALESKLTKNRFCFTQVGRLSEQKGLETLLEANRILQAKGLDYEIWLIGDGARYKNKLESIIATQGLNNVRFLGFLENPYPIMAISDCIVLASHFEGFSLALLEAATLSKAIIVSDIPAIREVLSDDELGECAMFFTLKNANDLALKMQDIYENPKRRTSLEAKATKRATFFDINKAAKAFKSILQI